MASNITLTSSMRSNLSSLKSLASQMSTTQTRLSTGKKVNSAIDNANSYYQSRALTSRSSDLDMLLDAMGQSIQTITAAVQGLEATGEMLENAAVIAQNAYETAIIPEKAWFEEQVGPNGAVVSTAQELRDAIAANKETICVYGKIDMGNTKIVLRNSQKLVGIEYFNGYTGNKKFSEINFSGDQRVAINTANNNVISDLRLNFETSAYTSDLILTSNYNVGLKLNNLDLRHISTGSAGSSQGAIHIDLSSSATLSGVINLEGDGIYGNGIVVWNNSNLTIAKDAVVNIKTHGPSFGAAFDIITSSTVDVYGKVNTQGNGYAIWMESGTFSGNSFNVHNGAEINIKDERVPFNLNSRKNETTYNILSIDAGAKVNVKDAQGEASLISNGYVYENNTTSSKYLYSSTLRDSWCFTEVSSTIDWSTWSAIPEIKEAEDLADLAKYDTQYSEMISAFDELVSDAGYQGVNLLNNGNIDVMFNETRTHSYNVQGKDMSSAGIGITSREWVTKDDVAQSIKEIKNAMNSVRDMVENLGNHLSIIQTRMNFTDAMTDILQTGADDLVLADMNEESANYLALQTRNSLAVNALALAAQSNNSVLKLF